jgi:arginase
MENSMAKCILIGAPIDEGQKRPGCLMGPAAYRVAGLGREIADSGHGVQDWGDLALGDLRDVTCPNPAVHSLPQVEAWTRILADRVDDALSQGGLPIILGGDHSLALGTVLGAANHAARVARPLFVLWLDAHSDFHTPLTTTSGNLHGTPVAYISGHPGFEALPAFTHPVPPERICLFGIRSVDPAEHAALLKADLAINDMRVLDERGIVAPLREFLNRVQAAGGMLHVSLDVDFLDPTIAPAVGTTVPGGATFREAHLVMELLHESGLVTSLDLVGSLLGKKVFDRPTRSY